MNDTFYLYARFKSFDATKYYTNNKNYLLRVVVGRLGKKVVKVTHVDTETRKPIEGTERRYENKAYFEKSWKVISDKTHEQ